MSQGFRETFGRALYLVAVFVPLVVAMPGCGEEPKKDAGASSASPLPPNVSESNNNMMKTQKTAPSK